MKLKELVIALLSAAREGLGRLECKARGHCDSMVDCVEFDSDMNYFYPCCRCGRDAFSGKTFAQWADETKSSVA